MPNALLAALLSLLASSAAAQEARPSDPAPVKLTAQQDHKLMMDALGIRGLREGANGMNPRAPNAANYDEAKANPYPKLPDPLALKNGEKVTTAEAWWSKRRPEIVEDFDREVYGRVPKDVPKVAWEVTATTEEKVGDIAVVTKRLVGHVDNSRCPQITVDIQLTLTTPKGAKGPVPVMMEFGFGGFGFRPGGPPGKAATPKGNAPQAKASRGAGPGGFGGGGPSWQQQVLARGWGYAIIVPNSIQVDNGAGLTRGIIGLCNKGQPRKPDDWGALRAWAWGASRALDYFETDKAVDAKQVGIEGLSRYGKAALVAMAYDPRFAIGFIGSSGEGGAKLHRRNFGELVENLTGSGEYHWMAGNFLKYGGPLTPGDLPVDAHELIALCAPRPTFISYGASTGPGAEGQWVDQRGSFMAAVAAGPVFRLLGKKDLGTSEFPAVETSLIDGELAFRQHKGGHTTGPNWPAFLEFAGRYIKVAHAQADPANHVAGRLVELNDNGAWSWFMDDRAVVLDDTLVVGSVRSVGAFAAGTSDPNGGNVEISTYNLTSGDVRKTVLHPHFEQDDHDGPALLVLPDRRILALYSKHGQDRKILYRFSEPGDPLSWGPPKVFEAPGHTGAPFKADNVTYNNLFRLSSGRIYNLYRGIHLDPNWMFSDDEGRTWQYGGHLFLGKGGYSPYLRYASDGKEAIHFVATEDHPRNFDNGLYHGYIRDGQVHYSDGQVLGPLSKSVEASAATWDLTRVFAGNPDNVAWIDDVKLDLDGHPRALFSVKKDGRGTRGKGGMDIRFHHARWDGRVWQSHEIAHAGTRLYKGEDDYTGLAVFDRKDLEVVYISTNADPVTGRPLESGADNRRHHELFRGTTADSGMTWRWEAVTANSGMDNLRPIVPYWRDPRTILVWMRGEYKYNRGEWTTSVFATVLANARKSAGN